MSATDRSDTTSGSTAGFAQGLADAARENPLSTALIGMGALWLFMGGSRISIFGDVRDVGGALASKVGAGVASVATPVSQAASSGYGAVRDQVTNLGTAGSTQVGETLSASGARLSDVAGSVGDGLKTVTQRAVDLASQTRSSVYDMASAAPQHGRDMVAPLQGSLSDLWNRQPLVLGVLGVAVGATLAAALPHFAVEDRLIGEAGDKLKTEAKAAFSAGAEKLSGVVDAVTTEAQHQGLTPDAAKQAVGSVVNAVSGTVQAQGSGGSTGTSKT